MLERNKVPDEVIQAWDERGNTKTIEHASAKAAFNEYCEWEGLVNYGPLLWHLVEQLMRAERKA